MFADLLNHQCYRTLPIGHVVAAWFLRGEDLEWLNKEYQKMYELFKDSPAIQWIEESGRQDERKKAELRVLEERKKAENERRKAEQKMLEERKIAVLEERRKAEEERKNTEQKMLEERRKAEEERKNAEQKILEERRKAEEEHKKTLATLRQTVVALVAQRFPTLERLARAQVRLLDQTERFPQVLLHLSLARDFDEAQEVLLALHENDDVESTPEAP